MYITVAIFIYFKLVSFWKNDRGSESLNGLAGVRSPALICVGCHRPNDSLRDVSVRVR